MKGEDINVEDVVNKEMLNVREENKSVAKAIKLLERVLVKINEKFRGERKFLRDKIDKFTGSLQSNVDQFVDGLNADIDKFKQKYEAMYAHLVRTFLVKMESRVFSLEIFSQATLEQQLEKLYKLERRVMELEDRLGSEDIFSDGAVLIPKEPKEGRTQLAWEYYVQESAKHHETLMQKHADEFAKKTAEEAKQELGEEENVALQEETKIESKDPERGEDQEGNSDNSEDDRADSQEDSGQAEPRTQTSEDQSGA